MKKLSKMHRRVQGLTSELAAASAKRAMKRQMREMGYTAGDLSQYDKEVVEHQKEAAVKQDLKGRKDFNCNRTACQKPGAFFLNIGTSKYYCLECTVDIGGFSLSTTQDPMDLYPDFDEDMARYEQDYVAGRPAYAQQQVDWAKREWARAREIFSRRQPAHQE